MKTELKIPAIALAISFLGILTIYSSTYMRKGEFWQSMYQRQILWVALGLVAYIVFSRINYRRIWDWTYVVYALVITLLMLVVVTGIIRFGAQRWLKIAWFNLQPSELAKFAVLIYLARYFSKKSPDNVGLNASRYGIINALIVPFFFVAIPAAFIIEQPDLGTAALIFFLFLSMLYLGNVRLKYLVFLICLLAAVMPFAWYFLHGYQRDRILVFLNPNIDPLGAGYTIIQSKIAIGSGGFFGKGWLAGTQSQLFSFQRRIQILYLLHSLSNGVLLAAHCFLLYITC